MPTSDETVGFNIGHPAPDRDRISRWTLLFAFGGGAAAWSLQIAVNASVGGLGCGLGDGPGTVSPVSGSWIEPTLKIVDIGALAVVCAALLVSIVCLRRTRREREEDGGVIDAGEGRSRFVAVWGIFSNLLFLSAITFSTVSAFWGGLCQF